LQQFGAVISGEVFDSLWRPLCQGPARERRLAQPPPQWHRARLDYRSLAFSPRPSLSSADCSTIRAGLRRSFARALGKSLSHIVVTPTAVGAFCELPEASPEGQGTIREHPSCQEADNRLRVKDRPPFHTVLIYQNLIARERAWNFCEKLTRRFEEDFEFRSRCGAFRCRVTQRRFYRLHGLPPMRIL
jgi:hypothetical protein